MLSNFQVNNKALVQTFLLGQEEFKVTLQSPGMEQFRQRIIASYHLEPLSADETEKYIKHRLQLVGWENDPEFENGVFKLIYEFTDGVPRRINAMCDRMLLFSCLEELHIIDKDVILSVTEELEQEVSCQPQKHHNQPQLTNVTKFPSAVPNIGQPTASPYPTSADDLVYRIQELEKEISNLKQTLRNEQKLLRKAILLQMDLDEYEDLE